MSDGISGRIDQPYRYFGGPRDGELFELGVGALIPHVVSLEDVPEGEYVVNVELRRYEWRSAALER